MQQPASQPVSPLTRIFQVALLGIALIYLVNCLTPLRLHVDMIRYFLIKDCIEFGCPPDSDQAHDYMPYGYTALLLLLSKTGLLHSIVLVLINCIYLFAACWLTKKLFAQSTANSLGFILLTLLNWTVIKFVTHALSEMQYLFFSTVALYLFQQYNTKRKLPWLFAAFIAGGLAFITRTVGITLFGALCAGVIWIYREQVLHLIKKHKVIVAIAVLLVILVVIFSRQLGLNHYTGVMSNQFNKGLTRMDIIGWHCKEWSEILFNLSIVKVAPWFPHGLEVPVFIACGIALFATFIYILFRRSPNVPVIVKIYFVFYSALMFNWPFYDPRFWVPMLPIIYAVIVGALPLTSLAKALPKRITIACIALYSILGIGSIAYMTYTSLDKKVFAKTQARGVYRNEYEIRFYGHPLSDTAKQVNQDVLSILKRYN